MITVNDIAKNTFALVLFKTFVFHGKKLNPLTMFNWSVPNIKASLSCNSQPMLICTPSPTNTIGQSVGALLSKRQSVYERRELGVYLCQILLIPLWMCGYRCWVFIGGIRLLENGSLVYTRRSIGNLDD